MGRANRKCEAERRSCSSMFFFSGRSHSLARRCTTPGCERKEREEREWESQLEEGILGKSLPRPFQPSPLSTDIEPLWSFQTADSKLAVVTCRGLWVHWFAGYRRCFFFLIVFTAICVENTLKLFQILCDTPALCCVCRVDRNMSPVGWCCYIPVGGVSRNNPCNSRTVATVPTCFIEYIHAVLWRVLSKNYLAGLISKFVLIVEEKWWL